VLYNNSDNNEVVPVNAGRYVVKVEVAESDEYALTTLELPDTFNILKAEPSISLLNYSFDSVEYSGKAHTVNVSPKGSIIGLGDITVKYNGSAAAPADAGTYVVSVDIAEGNNYLAASGLALGRLIIYKVLPTAVEFSSASTLSAYVVNGILYLIGEVESVRVVNTGGSVVMLARATGGSTLSVAHLPTGVYFVALQGKGEARVVKLQVVN
jgi:hypothetical protein